MLDETKKLLMTAPGVRMVPLNLALAAGRIGLNLTAEKAETLRTKVEEFLPTMNGNQLRLLARKLRAAGVDIQTGGKVGTLRQRLGETLLGGREIPVFVADRPEHWTYSDWSRTHPDITDEIFAGMVTTWNPVRLPEIQGLAASGVAGETPASRVRLETETVTGYLTDANGTERFGAARLLRAVRQGIRTAARKEHWINTTWSHTETGPRIHDKTRRSHERKVRGASGTGPRLPCNKNEDHFVFGAGKPKCMTPNGIPSFVAGDAHGEGSFWDGFDDCCPTCGGPAEVEIFRPGVSTINGEFHGAFVLKHDGQFVTDAHTNRPKTCFVHRQKKGYRHAVKINGRSVWIQGQMVRCLYPVTDLLDGGETPLDFVGVWVFVQSGAHGADIDAAGLTEGEAEVEATMTRQISRMGGVN